MARDRFRVTCMHDGYVDTATYKAMARGALHYMKVDAVDVFVLGLPVATFVQKRGALERAWTGEHETAEGRKVVEQKVIALAQSQGRAGVPRAAEGGGPMRWRGSRAW